MSYECNNAPLCNNSLVNHSWINNKQSSNYTVVIEYALLLPVTEHVMVDEII